MQILLATELIDGVVSFASGHGVLAATEGAATDPAVSINLILLLLFVSGALGISFLCSLLEAALLSARLFALTEQKEAGNRGAKLLLEIKQTRLDDAISAILTLNTIANTAGAALAGTQFRLVYQEWAPNASAGDGVASGIFAGLLTLLILFLAEIPPKTLGAVYSTQLTGVVGWTLHFLIRLMSPVLFVTRAFTRLLAHDRGVRMSRGEIMAFIAMATKEGALEAEESEVFSNFLQFQELTIEEVMTPRTVAVMADANVTVDEFLADPSTEPFSRVPIYDRDRDDIVGYILMKDLYKRVMEGADRSRPIREFARKAWYVPEVVSMFDALKQFLQRREHMAVVTDEHGGVSGLVTLEDLVETILGAEILDESDEHADLQVLAEQLRNTRLQRLRNVHRVRRPPEAGTEGTPR
ncbi:MAG: hemolysin family protein [Planctomycetota bacterium]